VFLCVVLSCVGRGLGAGLIAPPKETYQMSKGTISKKKFRRLDKASGNKRKKKKNAETGRRKEPG
jgi:hypothetical protein